METHSQTDVALPEEERIDLLDYWHVVRKHAWTIGTVFVSVLAVVLLWTLHQTKIYEAVATIDIEQSTPQVLGNNVQDVVDLAPSNYWFDREYYETQYRVITSRAVIQRALDRLGLAQDPVFLGVDKIADPEERKRVIAKTDPVALLQSKIKVDPIKDAHLVYIRADDPSPERAALYASAVAQAYLDQNADQRLDATKSAADWLQGQMGSLKTQLEGSEVALYNYKRDNDILSMSLEDQENTTSQKLRTLADEITKAQTRKIELAAQVREIHALARQGQMGDFREDAFAPVLKSALVENLKDKYFLLKQKVAELSERYEASYPKLLEAQAQLATARVDLQKEIDQIVAATESDYAVASDAEAGLERLFAQVRVEAFEINKKEIAYKKLDREAKDNQRLYELVLKRLKETDLSVLLKTNNIHLLDAPIVPRRPVKPNLPLNALVAIVLGLSAGVSLAFVLERLDNTFKSQEDVERLGLAFLGILPTIAEEGKEVVGPRGDLFVHTHPKSSVAECCRSIRTNLLFMSPDQPLRRLLVTSSGPQEGKTTTAISLAIAMAQSGSRVLIVDTDMRRPRLHRAFGTSNEVGLSSAVVGEAPIDTCIKSTEIPNLWVLPCGPIPPNPAELLHATRFQEIRTALAERFDRVIYDSPPIAAVSDAAVLSTQVDGTLLVLKAGRTTRELAHRGVAALQSVNARITGAVLNDLDLDSREYGYYSYYYYRRGYYGEEKPSKAAG